MNCWICGGELDDDGDCTQECMHTSRAQDEAFRAEVLSHMANDAEEGPAPGR